MAFSTLDFFEFVYYTLKNGICYKGVTAVWQKWAQGAVSAAVWAMT